ncbi:MAG: FlgD immunoglobulin-like domain containing protein [Bacteroidota bacterium]
MKIKTIIILNLLLLINFSFAQNKINLAKVTEGVQLQKESYPVHARPYLEKFYKDTGFDIAKEELLGNRLLKAAWNFQVGTAVNWKAHNFQSSSYYDVPSTCQKVGTNCYIFVENAIWGVSVNQTSVDKVGEAFDSKTPANASKGIYQTNVETFGAPPNVDGDSKIIILILDIKDDYAGPGSGYVAGYFSSTDQTQSSNSNKAEIYYLDGVQSNLTTAGGLETAMATTAHEFQHMIHFNYIVNDETFYDECWSLSAEIVNGYELYSPGLYAGEPNQWLYRWRDDLSEGLNDYSRAARFGLYLYEQFGAQIFKKYLDLKIKGGSGLNSSLTALGFTRQLPDILPDWFIANYLNDKSVDSKWGYDYPDLPQMDFREHVNPNVTMSDQVHNMGVQYITYTDGENLTVNFSNSAVPTNLKNNFKVKAIKYGVNPEVESVTVNSDYNLPTFGTDIGEVTFLVYMDNISTITGGGPFNYSYTSSGTFESQVIELAYDLTEPTGLLDLTAGDSLAVVFEGYPGAQIDSIRIALRNNVAPVHGGIYKLLGLSNRLGGTKLAGPISVNGTSTPQVINPNGDYPYPQPYPNWATVDLSSQNISASDPFTVQFVFEGTYPGSNRVLVTEYQSPTSYNSFWYRAANDDWIYYSVSDRTGYIFLNLIRAYISYSGSEVSEPIEILPSAFSLEQNYPNPFNPETVISFSLPTASNVQIKIYDILGNEIRTLIDEERYAGKHNIYWNATDNFGRRVTSGVYFYKVTADPSTSSGQRFVQTKKMVLMK